MNKLFPFLLLAFISTACLDEGEDVDNLPEYSGPIMEVSDAETLYSDSATVLVKVTAPRQLEYQNGNQDFPEGFNIILYEKDGSEKSTIIADQGHYEKAENKYTATGNVIVKNVVSGDELRTEVLYWEPGRDMIHTDRYVEITSGGEIIMGEGLTSNQDFSSYRILKPTGAFSVN